MECVTAVTIPKQEGRTVTMKEGQQLRIVVPEGPQAADVVAINSADLRESASAWLTRQMSGSFVTAKQILTKLPAGRVMFEVEEAPKGVFWLSPGRCNRFTYERRGENQHANCQDILAGCLEPHGFSAFDVPEVLNLFMRAQLRTDGGYEFLPSDVQAGDYVALRARMDVLVAVSACPDDADYNAGHPKPLELQIWE